MVPVNLLASQRSVIRQSSLLYSTLSVELRPHYGDQVYILLLDWFPSRGIPVAHSLRLLLIITHLDSPLLAVRPPLAPVSPRFRPAYPYPCQPPPAPSENRQPPDVLPKHTPVPTRSTIPCSLCQGQHRPACGSTGRISVGTPSESATPPIGRFSLS